MSKFHRPALAILLSSLYIPTFAQAASGSTEGGADSAIQLYATIAAMAFIVGVFLAYMYILQKRFFNACLQDKQLTLFSQSPAGLPEGTIRAVMALLIVTSALYFLALSFWMPEGKRFPEVLSGLLGTIIGFYFGSRKSGGDGESAAMNQARQMTVQRDEAISGQAGSLLEKVNTGLSVAKAVAAFLPDEMGVKYLDVAGKVQDGIKTVQTLLDGGKATEALAKAEEISGALGKEGPLADLVGNAVKTFGATLGTFMPPAALVMSLVAVTVKLTGVYYQKWKVRVLHMPFSPAAGLKLDLVDANTGFTLIQQSPIFRDAFQAKIGDRAFLKQALDDFLTSSDNSALLQQYGEIGHFQSAQQFEDGLEEFRLVAADNELNGVILANDPNMLGQAGGYQSVMAAVDKIHQDPEALKSLDALMMATEKLQSADQPVAKMISGILEEKKA